MINIINNKVNQLNEQFEPYFNQQDGYNNKVIEAMEYAFNAGGKRLRPLIIKSVYDMLTDEGEDISPYTVAIEMIHTYSLIHDDLPAMDDDDLRRGKPSCHIAFGEDLAILAGDGLLNMAYEVMIKDITIHPDMNRILSMSCLATSSGIHGMVAGQVVDIQNNSSEIDDQTLNYIHLHKTAALIKAAFKMGAHLANAEDSIVEAMGEAGEAFGLAFQIQDDILDYLGTESELGKPIRSDEKNNKDNYLAKYGFDISTSEVEKQFMKSINVIKALKKEKSKFIIDLLMFFKERKK
jgi:geranylgeranyl diphosphate synthase type II